MTDIEEIKRHLSEKFPRPIGDPHTVEFSEGSLCINGTCILPIILPNHYDRANPIEIIDETSLKIGEVVFLDKTSSFEINSIPEINLYCFLCEYPISVIADNSYKFLYDYILIKKIYIKKYVEDYLDKSPIWGGFFHKEKLINNPFTKTITIPQIKAVKDIVIDRQFYLETLELALKENNPFNRFLKLYHLIEMQFDMHTAVKINSLLLAGNKEREISITLKDYNREDIERLFSLFKEKIDKFGFERLLNNVIPFKSIAHSIFYDYGKDSNPLKSKTDFDKIIGKGSFNKINIDAVCGPDRFNNLIPKIIAYWIYRVRSSIAHNKLGEYLMTINDEEFVIEFAEPLLREVIIQCYKI